ncbi:MAG TPA: chemotaxis protein, partial [Pseudomonas sp.]|nr:chemotaxis protein [Pseudomonas sp.]
MFNGRLKQQLAEMQDELSSTRQIKDSLYSEMLVLEFDPEGRVRFANDNLLEALRYRREALIGRALDELIPDSFRSHPNHPALLKALRNPEHWSGAFRLLCGDGKEAWLRAIWQPVNNGLGKLQYFTLCANDLTATITTAKEHESLIKALLRSTAVIEFKLTGEVVTANENFLRAMGYRLEQIQGKHHQLFCSPEEHDSPAYRDFWAQLNRGEYVAGRFKRLDSMGRTVWLEASYNPVLDAHDRLYKVVKFATLITDQVNQEQAVSEAAGIAYDISRKTDQSADKGAAVVQQTLNVMQQIVEKVQEAAAGIEALDKQSQLISTIMQTIRGIADQTNLL